MLGRRGACAALVVCVFLPLVSVTALPESGQVAAGAEWSGSGASLCSSTGVSLAVVPGTPAMGRADRVVLVTNRGRTPCAVAGRPAIRFLGPGGRVGGAATPSPSAAPAAPLVLDPGETAAALLSGSDRPLGTATSCPSYPAYAVLATLAGKARTVAGPLADCAGLTVTPFVPGFNGTSTSGRVSGRAPGCQPPPTTSGPGAFVEIDAWSGRRLTGSVTVLARASGEEPYTLVLPPGRYRIVTHSGASRTVVVRPGRTTGIGLFGVCTLPPATVTTIPSGAATATTSTTLPASVVTAAPPCTTSQVDVSALAFGAATGHVSEVIQFKNLGASLCTLTGYPGVAALNAQGGQVLQARRSLTAFMGGQDTGTEPMTVRLEPGQVATATVEGSDNPLGGATSCVHYPALLVTVPGETRSVVLTGVGWQGAHFSTQGFPGCSPLVVTPVVPGDNPFYP